MATKGNYILSFGRVSLRMHSFISITCRNTHQYHSPPSAEPTAIDHMQRTMSRQAAILVSLTAFWSPRCSPMQVARQKNLSSTMVTESTDSRARAGAGSSGGKLGMGRNRFSKGAILLDAAGPVSGTAARAPALLTLKILVLLCTHLCIKLQR